MSDIWSKVSYTQAHNARHTLLILKSCKVWVSFKFFETEEKTMFACLLC